MGLPGTISTMAAPPEMFYFPLDHRSTERSSTFYVTFSTVPREIGPLTEEDMFLLSPETAANLLKRRCANKRVPYCVSKTMFVEFPGEKVPCLVLPCLPEKKRVCLKHSEL